MAPSIVEFVCSCWVTVGNNKVYSSMVCNSTDCSSMVSSNVLLHQYPEMAGVVVVAQVVGDAVTIIPVIVGMADIIPTNVIILMWASGCYEIVVCSYWFLSQFRKLIYGIHEKSCRTESGEMICLNVYLLKLSLVVRYIFFLYFPMMGNL